MRIRGTGIAAGLYRRTISIVRGSQVLLQPALVTYLHRVILVAIIVANLGGAAGKIGIGHVVHRVLHIGHRILQAVDLALLVVDLILQTGDVSACDIDGLIVTRVGGEGAHSLAILRDGEHTVARSRSQVSTLVAVVSSLGDVAETTDRQSIHPSSSSIIHETVTIPNITAMESTSAGG